MEIIDNNTVYDVPVKCFNDFIYKHSIVHNKFWDEEIVNEILKYLPDGTDILDIGANVGLITLGLIKRAKEENRKLGNIHCFECCLDVIPLLSYNISSFDNVKLYPFALSDKQELCQVTTLEMNMGCNYIYNSTDKNKKTEYDYSMCFYTGQHDNKDNTFILGIPLDSIGFQFTNRIGVMKIDVEGFEVKVIKGATELIKKHKPVIIIEIFEKIHLDIVINLFKELNYNNYIKVYNSMYNNEDYVFFPN
jgi:FkbM family methyltransferase